MYCSLVPLVAVLSSFLSTLFSPRLIMPLCFLLFIFFFFLSSLLFSSHSFFIAFFNFISRALLNSFPLPLIPLISFFCPPPLISFLLSSHFFLFFHPLPFLLFCLMYCTLLLLALLLSHHFLITYISSPSFSFPFTPFVLLSLVLWSFLFLISSTRVLYVVSPLSSPLLPRHFLTAAFVSSTSSLHVSFAFVSTLSFLSHPTFSYAWFSYLSFPPATFFRSLVSVTV